MIPGKAGSSSLWAQLFDLSILHMGIAEYPAFCTIDIFILAKVNCVK
jgi:hypothetical protein